MPKMLTVSLYALFRSAPKAVCTSGLRVEPAPAPPHRVRVPGLRLQQITCLAACSVTLSQQAAYAALELLRLIGILHEDRQHEYLLLYLYLCIYPRFYESMVLSIYRSFYVYSICLSIFNFHLFFYRYI